MYTIYADDYETTAIPQFDSDGRVEIYWDHPKYPQKWCARHAPYPYNSENWTPLTPFSEKTTLDVWSPYIILLDHFGLLAFLYNAKASSKEILKLPPETLKALGELPYEIKEKGLKASFEYLRETYLRLKKLFEDD